MSWEHASCWAFEGGVKRKKRMKRVRRRKRRRKTRWGQEA